MNPQTGEMLANSHGREFERLGQRFNTGAGLALEMMEDPLARAVHTNARYEVDPRARVHLSRTFASYKSREDGVKVYTLQTVKSSEFLDRQNVRSYFRDTTKGGGTLSKA